MATRKTIAAAALAAITIMGGATACTGEAEPAAATVLWKDQDADGDGIPNGQDTAVAVQQEEAPLRRAGVCQQLDNGITPPHLDDPVHAGRQREKVVHECPEHLAAFDAAVATPAPAPAPVADPLTWAEEEFIQVYRARTSEDVPDRTLLDTAGQVCTALKNRDEDAVRRDLERVWGLSEAQADGLIRAASGQRCVALGW